MWAGEVLRQQSQATSTFFSFPSFCDLGIPVHLKKEKKEKK